MNEEYDQIEPVVSFGYSPEYEMDEYEDLTIRQGIDPDEAMQILNDREVYQQAEVEAEQNASKAQQFKKDIIPVPKVSTEPSDRIEFKLTGKKLRLPQSEEIPEIDIPDDMILDEDEIDEEDLVPATEEEVQYVMQTGQAPPNEEDLVPATKKDLDNYAVDVALASGFSAKLADELGEGPLTAGKAANTLKAKDAFFSKERGVFDHVFYRLNVPQQALVRQTVNMLENIDALSTDEAKRMLSHDELAFSDLVNFYTRDTDIPSSAKFLTGLALDVILDPLNLVGVGLANGARKAVVGTKAFLNLDKLSKAERVYLKAAEKVEKVLLADHKLIDKVPEKQIKDLLDIETAKGLDSRMGFDDMATNLGASPETKKKIMEVSAKEMTEQSFFRDFAEGKRALTMGYNIPFTNFYKEMQIPLINELVTSPISKGVVNSYDWLNSTANRAGLDLDVANKVKSVFTNTGKILFDSEMRSTTGRLERLKYGLLKEGDKFKKEFAKIKEIEGEERFEKIIDDLLEEQEMRSFDPNELLKETDRSKLFQKYPVLEQYFNYHNGINELGVQAYKERGLPFNLLEYKGPGSAKRYVKHVVTKEWKDKFREGIDDTAAVEKALSELTELGKVDPSALGRKYFGTISEANKYALDKHNIKMFVDDPLELTAQRAIEMQRVVNTYDLLDTAKAYAKVGGGKRIGWKEFDWSDFGKLTINKFDDTGAEIKSVFDAYVPEFYKKNKHIYLPEDVYERLTYHIEKESGKPSGTLMQVFNKFQNLFSNTMLFGTGYLGQNLTSNMMTFALNYGVHNMKKIYDSAMKLLFDKADDILIKSGGDVIEKIPHEQFMREAYEDGMLRSAFYGNIGMDDLAENIASLRDQRNSTGKTIKNLWDTVSMWKYNRWIAEKSDIIPKLAAYTLQRERGFSRKAAAESVEKYFYNFAIGGKAQDVVSKVIPFSRFGIKSAEMLANEFSTLGGLAKIQVPYKAASVLEGAYVPDANTRYVIQNNFPGYLRARHPVLGPILPGMREVILELPFAQNTVASLLDPANNLHPVINTMLMAVNAMKDNDDDAPTLQDFAKPMLDVGYRMFPFYLRKAAELYDLQTNGFGGVFAHGGMGGLIPSLEEKEPYGGALPLHGTQILDKYKVGDIKMTDSKDFATALSKEYGDDFLFNMVFKKNPFQKGDETYKIRAAAQAEWLRRHFRDITFGSASLSKLDSNFLMNFYAIDRQIQKKEATLANDLYKSGRIGYELSFDDKHLDELKKQKFSDAAEIQALKWKQEALVEFYDFIYQHSTENTGVDLLKSIFGISEKDAEMYSEDQLIEKYTVDDEKMTDEEIAAYINALEKKKGNR